jgi:hypothetical protein
MKKNRKDETIHVIIHIDIVMPQGNSLCSYLKQEKMPFLILSSKKSQWKGRTSLAGWGVVSNGTGRC